MLRALAHSFPKVPWLVLVGALAGAPAGSQVAPEAGASFELPTDPSAVVLEYHEIVGMIAGEDRGPSLLIRADGSGVVHFPAYMKRAGVYELRISRAELRELVGSLVAEGLLEMEPAAMLRAKRRAEAEEARRARDEGAPLTAVSDESKTVITLRLAAYRRLPAGPIREDVEKTLTWHGLRTDAERFPGVTGLAALARAATRLERYLTHPDLTRLEERVSPP